MAEPLLKKAFSLYVLDLGEDHPHVAGCCSRLGRVCLMQDHPTEAEECSKSSVAISERAGANPLETAAILEDYAAVLRKMARKPEAERLETRARSLRESLGKSEPTKRLKTESPSGHPGGHPKGESRH